MIKMTHRVTVATLGGVPSSVPGRHLSGMPVAVTSEVAGITTLTIVPHGSYICIVPNALQFRDVRRAVTKATTETGFDWRALWSCGWQDTSFIKDLPRSSWWVNEIKHQLDRLELVRIVS